MEAGLILLPDNINPSTFPAKLWRLVNNPSSTAICWDHLGKTIVINQELFESQILSSTSSPSLDNTGSFKTTNFCSFVRQLNLYGFKKISPVAGSNLSTDGATYHCFFHKNFNRNHPELVADLRRLTADNKAKLSAGLKVSHRPWTSRRGSSEDRDGDVTKSSVSPQSPTNPNCLDTAAVKAAQTATPVYPLYLMTSQVDGAAVVDQTVSPNQFTTRLVPCSNVIFIKQTSPVGVAQQSPNLISDYVSPGLSPTGLYSPSFQSHDANLESLQLTAGGLDCRPFSPPCNQPCVAVDDSQDLLCKTFQIAEELMPLAVSNGPVRVEASEETF